jgi:tRNA (adenine37-N6)-methyltransferase
MDITLKPIGTVHSPLQDRERRDASAVIAEIIIEPEYAAGLDNLEDFSHIIVIFYLHQSRKPAPLKVHPRMRKDPAPVGVFASRSPDRPNALGKTTVKLLEHHDNILKVKGLDAIDGTPVIDIKPYIPDIDATPEAKVPPWMTQS